MSVFESLLSVLLPVGIAILAGALFARMRPGPMTGLNEVIFHVSVPALVYHTAATMQLDHSVVLSVGAAALTVSLGCGLAATLWFRFTGVREARGLILASALPNNANLGMSLCLFAFGETGLALATAFYATTVLVSFTVGIWLLSSEQSGLREVLRVPVLYALLAGVLVQMTGWEPPAAINRGFELLGQAAIPCMLLSLGHRLANTSIQGQAKTALVLASQATVIRVGLGMCLGWLATLLIPMSELERHVTIVQASMPTAVITTVMSERYGHAPGLVANTVALSTLLCLLVLPLLLGQMLGG